MGARPETTAWPNYAAAYRRHSVCSLDIEIARGADRRSTVQFELKTADRRPNGAAGTTPGRQSPASFGAADEIHLERAAAARQATKT
jgi:hypothetical protein